MYARSLYALAEQFCSIRTPEQLGGLLFCHEHTLVLTAANPVYRTFKLPKKESGFRIIEDPNDALKKILGTLNDYLQATLYRHRNAYMFGFLVNAEDDAEARHIVSNAEAHEDAVFLLNIDLKDFFHHISWIKTKAIFTAKPFRFPDELATLLANLCTYNGRLPMGSPTSPALSNFAAMSLDTALGAYAKSKNWRFTRYADDLSFSSENKISETESIEIQQLIANYDFVVNPKKVKLMGEKEEKIVTGILLAKGKIGIPPAYMKQLRDEIEHLAYTVILGIRYKGRAPKWLNNYAQQIRGKLAFVEQVIGEHHHDYVQLTRQYKKALQPPEEDLAVLNWLDFPY